MQHDPVTPHQGLETATIRRPLPCVTCGYQLRGLAVGGVCPECGDPIRRSVLAVIDPRASGLPTLRNPRMVAHGLFGLIASLAVAAVLLVPRPLAARLELSLGAPSGRWVSLVPAWLPLAAAGVFGLALVFLVMLAPPADARAAEPGVTRGIRRLREGLVVLALAAAGFGIADVRPPFDAVEQGLFLLLCGAAIWTFLALRATVRVIGQRSRQYRTRVAARQGFREMAIATGVLVLGQAAAAAGERLGVGMLEFLGQLVAWVSLLMVLIGLAYMVVNAVWIQRALLRPPPTLAELLGGETHAARDADDATSSAGGGGHAEA